jgi:hypothetical protein
MTEGNVPDHLYDPPEAFEYVVLIGFEKYPESIYAEIEKLGGEVLQEQQYFAGGVVGRLPWWKYYPWRLLWRLGIKLGTRPREL